MKFSITVPGMTRYPAITEPWMTQMRPPDFQRAARRLEAIGFDSLDTPEHLALDAKLAGVMGGLWPHALASMAFFAGATERIRVNSSILILPLYHPVNLAKALSTLDMLSGSRVMLSVGLGHGGAEYRALGVPWDQRGRIADEYLQAMHVLWTEETPRFEGRYVSFDGIAFEPKLQKPLPVWIGGNSEAALRRAVRFGTGWRPWQIGLEELPDWTGKIDALVAELGREKPVQLHIPSVRIGVGSDHKPTEAKPVALSTSESVDRIGRLAAFGVTWTSLPGVSARSLEEHLDLTELRCGPVIAQSR
jgi:probable F420-dependent oxidoreductase